MFSVIKKRLGLASLALLAASTCTPASAAELIYANATGHTSTLSNPISNVKWVATDFTLTAATYITDITTLIVGSASGNNIFAAIVAVPDGSLYPNFTPTIANLQSAALGSALFNISGILSSTNPNRILINSGATAVATAEADFTNPLLLQAGTYAVILGSGAFGATGSANIGLNETIPAGQTSTSYALFSGAWAKTASNAEIAVYGYAAPTPTPEPSTWAMMLAGFGGIGFMARRKKLHLRFA
jgi:hypothetical protein